MLYMKVGSFIMPAFLAAAGILFILMGFNGLFFFRFLSTILIACGIVMIGISFSRLRHKQIKEIFLKGSWHCQKCKSYNLKDDKVCYSCKNPFKK